LGRKEMNIKCWFGHKSKTYHRHGRKFVKCIRCGKRDEFWDYQVEPFDAGRVASGLIGEAWAKKIDDELVGRCERLGIDVPDKAEPNNSFQMCPKCGVEHWLGATYCPVKVEK
jgi:hypothetical protein